MIRGALLAVAIAGLLLASGLGFVVQERLVGNASTPVSIGQRIVALQSIFASLPALPFFGVGPGGAAEFLLRAGAVVPNIENEYLIALVTGGPLAMLALVLVVVIVIRIVFRQAKYAHDPGSLALWVALSINLATFNIFSWSAGPPLFAAIMSLVVLTRESSAHPTRAA